MRIEDQRVYEQQASLKMKHRLVKAVLFLLVLSFLIQKGSSAAYYIFVRPTKNKMVENGAVLHYPESTNASRPHANAIRLKDLELIDTEGITSSSIVYTGNRENHDEFKMKLNDNEFIIQHGAADSVFGYINPKGNNWIEKSLLYLFMADPFLDPIPTIMAKSFHNDNITFSYFHPIENLALLYSGITYAIMIPGYHHAFDVHMIRGNKVFALSALVHRTRASALSLQIFRDSKFDNYILSCKEPSDEAKRMMDRMFREIHLVE